MGLGRFASVTLEEVNLLVISVGVVRLETVSVASYVETANSVKGLQFMILVERLGLGLIT